MVTMQNNIDRFIEALMLIVNAGANKTFNHSARVSEVAVKIAEKMDLNQGVVERIQMAAYLHDIGKIAISDQILNKPGRLKRSELKEVQKHPEFAYNILERLPPFKKVSRIILHHHERYDGLGYPKGLKGKAIPLEARIIAVADAFDAMTSDRPYRKALNYDQAYSEINDHVNEQFCPLVVECFNQLNFADLLENMKGQQIDNFAHVIAVEHEILSHSRKII